MGPKSKPPPPAATRDSSSAAAACPETSTFIAPGGYWASQPDKAYIHLQKKRWRAVATLSLVIHIIGASWVFFILSGYSGVSWTSSMQAMRRLFNLDEPDHNHDEHTILHVWMMAIQARYVITDAYAVYQALRNRRLLWTTVCMHFVEGGICTIFFLGHNSRDCFVFGMTCLIWTAMWAGAYLAMDYDNVAIEVKKMKKLQGLGRRMTRMRRELQEKMFSDTEEEHED
jgi:hypothetical protein